MKVPPGHLGVCNIQAPATGLECKFSLRMTTALALSGEDTFNEGLFTDATARRSDLVGVARARSAWMEPGRARLRGQRADQGWPHAGAHR